MKYGLLLTGITLATLILETLARRGKISDFIGRKATHISAAIACGAALLWIDTAVLVPTGLGATALLWFLVRGKWLKINDALPRQSWGIVFFGLAFTCIAFAWPYILPSQGIFALAVVGLADPAAAVMGRWKPFVVFRFSPDRKTFGGWLSFAVMVFLAAALTDAVSPSPLFFPLDVHSFLFLFYAGIALANVEVLCENGSDNLVLIVYSLGLGAAFLLPSNDAFHWAITFGLSAGIALASKQFKLLSFSGAVAVYPLAFLLFGLGGWKWTAPIAVFFILSSLWSKARSEWGEKDELIAEKSGVRDHFQVWANGGIPALIAIASFVFGEESAGYTFYLVAIGASAADTWSTEIGGLFGGRPRHIFTFKHIEKGRSGGVTWVGLIGGFAGAGSVALAGWLMENAMGERMTLLIWGVAFAGTLIDSALGAKFQGLYETAAHTLTESKWSISSSESEEVPHLQNKKIAGFDWLNNDRVNLVSVIFVVLAWTLVFSQL